MQLLGLVFQAAIATPALLQISEKPQVILWVEVGRNLEAFEAALAEAGSHTHLLHMQNYVHVAQRTRWPKTALLLFSSAAGRVCFFLQNG